MKMNFNTRKFKGGAYATTITAVVIAMVVIMNLIFTKLDITIDMTADGKYSLTEETIQMLGESEDNITLYYLAPTGEGVDIFDKILNQYTKYGKNLKLVTKDPVTNPKFASQYTDEAIEQYSIVVVNEDNGRSRYIPYSDMLIEEFGMDYNTYQYYSEITGLDMEGQINSAIGYVTSEDLPTIYEISGHGMQSMGIEVISMLEKANYRVKTGDEGLELISTTDIPEDCDLLIMQTPETDFTEEEVATLSNYMDRGGKLIFVVSYLNAEHPNLIGFMEKYGLGLSGGLILEGSSRRYMQAPYVLLPLTVAHDILDGVSSEKYIVAQHSNPIIFTEEVPEGITRTAFLTTSSTAYEKSVDAQSLYQEEGDASGTFNLGVHVEDSDTGAEMAVFSSYYMFYESYAGGSTFANIDLLVSAADTLVDAQNNTVAVRTVDLTEETLLVLTDAQINLWGLVTIVLLPLAFLICGIMWVVYRKKHC